MKEQLGERFEVLRPPPVENYHHFMGGGGGGPQQSVEGQDSSWKASKKVVVEVHLRCYQTLHYQCLHRLQGVLCMAKEHTPRFQSGCFEGVNWSIFPEEKAQLCSAA